MRDRKKQKKGGEWAGKYAEPDLGRSACILLFKTRFDGCVKHANLGAALISVNNYFNTSRWTYSRPSLIAPDPWTDLVGNLKGRYPSPKSFLEAF